MGARVRCRRRAGTPGQKAECDAYSPRDGRASVRHAEDVDGGDALSDEDAAECGDRDGAVAQRGPEVAPGLTTDSQQQKHAQTVVSTWTATGCVQFFASEFIVMR